MDSKTRLYGLFGNPVGHSLSPQMHNSAFAAMGINATYLAFPIERDTLREAVAAIRALQIGGVNVTIPYKVGIMPYLDVIDEEAKIYGAVNTIVNQDGILVGTNTDGPGYIRSLELEHAPVWRDLRVTLLGAGGAARSVAIAIARQGVEKITLVNRNQERAQELKQLLSSWCKVDVKTWEDLPQVVPNTSLLINGTPIGMFPNTGISPVPKELLVPDCIVSELVYNPLMTQLLKDAQEIGAKIHTGLGMFIHQGALAFQLWTGQQAPIEVMEKAVLHVLQP
jgi:shikimate dehydrogenase